MEETHLNPETPAPKSPLKRAIIPVVIILAVVIGALLLIKASTPQKANVNAPVADLTEGAEVPNFDLTGLDGRSVPISTFNHKVMMINFWATWCEACMEEMPSIVALRDRYAPKGFEILAVDVDENPQQVVPAVVQKYQMKFPVFTDKPGTLAEIFDLHAIPLTVIINHDRKILLVEPGGRDWGGTEVQQLMDKWLAD